jgi:hypothetical protein
MREDIQQMTEFIGSITATDISNYYEQNREEQKQAFNNLKKFLKVDVISYDFE